MCLSSQATGPQSPFTKLSHTTMSNLRTRAIRPTLAAAGLLLVAGCLVDSSKKESTSDTTHVPRS